MAHSPQVKPSPPKGREPPPSLFLHPSPAASHVSLPGIPSSNAGPSTTSASVASPATMQASGAQSSTLAPVAPPLNRQGSLLNPNSRTRNPLQPRLPTADSSRSADRTDALWAEMQATLEEVELSASGGTHVFGPDHDQKLADLRAAQIALAQAWARSEADDAIETTAAESEVRNLKGALVDIGVAGAAVGGAAMGGIGPSAVGGTAASAGAGPGGSKGGDAEGRSTAGTGSQPPGSSAGERLGAKLEEETEADILLARKRREANDQYFSRVDQGVRDVVAKLEEVAIAMKAVEQESRDVWAEDSVLGSAKP